MRNFKIKVMALVIALTALLVLPAQAQTSKWYEFESLPGGYGGLYTTLTNIDSANITTNPRYSEWTDAFSLFDGQTIYYDYVAGIHVGDTLGLIVQTCFDEDQHIWNADSISLVIDSALAYSGKTGSLSLSSLGRRVRLKVYAISAAGGEQEDDATLWIGFYSPGNDVINPRKNYKENYIK